MTYYAFSKSLRNTLLENLSAFQAEVIRDNKLKQAAVAIVLTAHPQDKEACILLTLRPNKINRHSGQYALPGGKMEEGESPLQASLRELREELGIGLQPYNFIGSLDDYPTRSGFQISPQVYWAQKKVDLKPNKGEVEKTFFIPLRELDSPDIPILRKGIKPNCPILSSFLPTLGHEFFAPTAAILYQFREVALRGKHTRVAQYDQPTFAWS
tara:strand:- start:300 stop:935 length:636 start_codon:yes stop_codon:yes gene_type:complete